MTDYIESVDEKTARRVANYALELANQYKNIYGIKSVPIIKNIHQTLYEAVTSNPKALDMNSWHTCQTTHCRAGWIEMFIDISEKDVLLDNLYKIVNSDCYYARANYIATLAIIVYEASGYIIDPIEFFKNNELAMADITRLANMEREQELLAQTKTPAFV